MLDLQKHAMTILFADTTYRACATCRDSAPTLYPDKSGRRDPALGPFPSPTMSSMASSLRLTSLIAKRVVCPAAVKKCPKWIWIGADYIKTTWLLPVPCWAIYSQVSIQWIWYWGYGKWSERERKVNTMKT